ncbi:MAG: hypothetical protein WC956_08025 [bacterium]
MKKICSAILIVLILGAWCGVALADALDQGREMARSGQLNAAAEFFNRYVQGHPDDKKLTPEALAWNGRILDAMADFLTGEAEKKCYWGREKARSPECMQREADTLNAKYGTGAFQYEHAVLFIYYTGSHYRQIISQFAKSGFAPEAEFYLLLHNLSGHPDVVLPKIKAFLSKYPKGDWHRRGLLLWARANEDIWFIHRKWSWVIYNDQVAPEELMIRAEPYRQEALKTYQQLMKDKDTFEGNAAAREYAALSASQDDNVVYSIVNDSSPGTLAAWGVSAPPQMPAQTREQRKGTSSNP